jgi:hypothetical protein
MPSWPRPIQPSSTCAARVSRVSAGDAGIPAPSWQRPAWRSTPRTAKVRPGADVLPASSWRGPCRPLFSAWADQDELPKTFAAASAVTVAHASPAVAIAAQGAPRRAMLVKNPCTKDPA